jgi:hypothetical protein
VNKLWLLTRRDEYGYEVYESAVVVAPDRESANNTHPADGKPIAKRRHENEWVTDPSHIECTEIGTASAHLSAHEVVLAVYRSG